MATFVLEVQNGKYQGKRIRINDAETLVGRDESAKVRIGSSEVSRRHCLITIQGDGLLVTDLKSSNGTFVNGVPIEVPTALGVGDTLTVGPMQMKLLGDQRSPSRPAATSTPPEKLTDDDIAAWLTDDAIPISGGDTSIVDMKKPGSSASLPVQSPPEPPRKKFRSIAEEAQDIIRRFQESQQAGEQPS